MLDLGNWDVGNVICSLKLIFLGAQTFQEINLAGCILCILIQLLLFDPFLQPNEWDILNNLGFYYDLYNGNYTVDCNGVVNGTAYIDSCGDCVGGTTGMLPCLKDCAGVWGGYSYLDSCNICVDSIRKQPCDTNYKKLGDSLSAFLDKPEFVDSLNKFRQNTAADTLEKAISLGTDLSTGVYKTTPIRIAQPGLAVNPDHSWPGMNIETIMHYHFKTLYACYSAGDFYLLQPLFANPTYEHIQSHYLFGAVDSSLFSMVIEDSSLYANFLSNFPKATFMDASTNGWDTAHSVGKDYYRVWDYLYNVIHLSDDDAFSQAMAFVMSKYNSGLIMYRRRNGESTFRKINTKEITNPTTGDKTYAEANCL